MISFFVLIESEQNSSERSRRASSKQIAYCNCQAAKGEVPPGCLNFCKAGHLDDQTSHAPLAKLWLYATELDTLSVVYPWCGSALTDTTGNLSDMGPLKLKKLSLVLYHQSYTLLKGLHIPPLGLEPAIPR